VNDQGTSSTTKRGTKAARMRGKWSEPALRVLRERYLLRDDSGQVVESADDLCWRVATAVAAPEDKWTAKSARTAAQAAENFYNLMASHQFLPNSPTLMNAGKQNNLQLSACYVVPVADSLTGIFDAVKHAALIHQSGGGCIAGDAHVFTTFCGVESIATLYERVRATGKPETVEADHVVMDVRDLGIETMALDPGRGDYERAQVTHLWRYDVPLADQVRVRGANGLEVTTSRWHPFMVFNGAALVERRADELHVGDILPTPNSSVRQHWPHTAYREVAGIQLDEEIAWLLGYYLGDGNLGWAKVPESEPRREKLRWRLFDGRTASLEHARDILARRFGVHVTVQQDTRGLYSLATTDARFIEQFRSLLAIQPGPKLELVFPEMVAKSPLPVVCAFLAGLVDSDGYVDNVRDRVTFTTQSQRLAEKVLTLCSLLGLSPAMRVREPRGKGRTVVFEVKLASEPHADDLRALISLHLHDTLKSARLATSRGKHDHSTADRLPIPFSAIEDILQSIGIVTESTSIHREPVRLGETEVWLHRWKEGLGVNTGKLSRVVSALRPLASAEYQARLDVLEHLAQGATTVEAIEAPEQSVPFYDFTVAGHSTYLAGTNGLTAIHNTGFSFSRLRPEGSMVASTHGVASGPVSFMKIFDGATEAVKQGGCVVPETRVSTSAGMVQIGTLGPTDAEPKSWHALQRPLVACTDEGSRRVEEFYHNGIAAVRRIRTSHGYSFMGTLEHRLRVIDETGAYVWRHLKDLRVGDWVALQKNTYPDSTDYRFAHSERTAHFNATEIKTPERPTEDLGEFIGYLIGDGCINYYNSGGATGRLILTVADAEPEVGERMLRLAENLFGVTPQVRKKPDDASTNYFFNSTELVAWLAQIGVTKPSTLDSRVPEVVFQGGAELARGFVRGLFSADGTVTKDGYPQLYTISRTLAEDMQQLLLALGVPSGVSITVNRSGALGKNPIYRLRVITREGLREFAERIGFITASKNERLDAGLEKAWEFNDVIPNQNAVVASIYEGPGRGSGPDRGSRGADRELYRDLQHYLPAVAAPRSLTRQRLETLVEKHEKVRTSQLASFLSNNQFYDQVALIEEDEAVTVDLSVEDNHTYIANGFVSHNTRRGANMGILRVDHPDILKFIDCKRDGSVTNFNISVAITDEFMRAFEADDEYDLIDPHSHEVTKRLKAREVMDRIVAAAWATGDPGLVFIDRANHSTANPIPEIETLEATNPCVVGETRLATSEGLRTMSDLHRSAAAVRVATDWRAPGQQLAEIVHGGAEALASIVYHEAAPVFQTGIQVPVRKLVTSHGIEITATPNHRFLTSEGYKRLDELEFGDTLLLQQGEGAWSTWRELPEIAYGVRSDARLKAKVTRGEAHPLTTWSQELGEVVGYVLGDGYVRRGDTSDVVGIAVDANDSALADTLQSRFLTWFGARGNRVERHGHIQMQYEGSSATLLMGLGVTPAPAHEKRVPESIFGAPRDAVIGFLRGLFSADGSVQIGSAEKGTCSVRLATSSKGLAQDVQQILLNLGIVSSVRLRREQGIRLLPDSKRELTEYPTQAQYEVIIDKANRDRFAEVVGFMQEGKQAALTTWISNKRRASNHEAFTTKVALIEDAGLADVFDTTEPVTHSIIVNGLATHQCGEQWLGPYDACNLGSINLGVFVRDGALDWIELERATRECTRFLDDVIDINPYPLSEVAEQVTANRRIGLGIMGWADLLFELGIRYDSDEAIALGERVMTAIRDWSKDESRTMAAERGPFPNWSRSIYKDGPELRNATRTTVAPTGSISILADCSSGIEPIFALAFQHRVKRPDGAYRVLDFVNPLFLRALQASDVADKDAVIAYVKDHGSLHGHPAAEHPALRAFITAHEAAPDWHIRMQAAFQRGVDNSISKCLAAGTLIPTSEGLLAVEDFSDNEEPDSFVRIADSGITVGGHRVLSHYFAGEKPATRIRLNNGVELTGSTESHRVYTPDGWKRMAELRVGDLVVGRFMSSHGAGGAALPSAGTYATNAKRVTVPERMTPQLAQLLGMLAADGHTVETTGAVGLTSASDEVLQEATTLMQELFGHAPRHTIDTRNPNVHYLTLNSRVLCRWVQNLVGQGAYQKRVPAQVLAGSAEEKLAFLRGVSLDGYHHPKFGLYVYAGMSQQLAYGVAELCRSFGLPLVRQHQGMVATTGHLSYKVLVSNELQELISCIEQHKNGAPHYATYQVQVDQEVVERTKLPTSHPFYSALRSIRQREALNCDNRTAERLGWSEDIPVYRVATVEDAGVLPLYDIEVEEAHEYVVNGIVSHNTINLPNSATYADVKSAYLLAWELGCLGITIFRDGSKGEQVLNMGVKQPEATAAAKAEPPAVTTQSVPATPARAAQDKRYRDGVKVRPEVVSGYTRSVRAPEGKVNITLNSDEDGLLEVFLNVGKAGSDVTALAEAVGRLISLHLRIDSPLSQTQRATEIAAQLRSIGGSSSIGFGADRVRSLPDAVARALELHLARQAAAKDVETPATPAPSSALPPAAPKRDVNGNGNNGNTSGITATTTASLRAVTGNLCPQCGCNTMVYEEGCKKCHSCGHSEC
jgi:ribonucleoside-diphosphate reductase alpha chain